MTSPKARRRAEPRPSVFVDDHGVTCVRVPLANTYETAILWKIDYDRLKAAGLSSYWFLVSNGKGDYYVRAKRPGFGLLMVARCVLEAEEGRALVRYQEKPTDLRRPHLYLASNPYSRSASASELTTQP